MCKPWLSAAALLLGCARPAATLTPPFPGVPAPAHGEPLRVVTEGLEAPWALSLGPDGWLWVTERSARRVLRVHPVSGEKKTALELLEAHTAGGQDGLLGMALHPQLGRGEDYVYLAYTYDDDPGVALRRRAQLVRYRYDAATQRLHSPRPLLVGLPAAGDHNSGRLIFGPDAHLYYTIGDQGRNQFDGKCEHNRAQELPSEADVEAQNWAHYEGKILRVALDGGIPRDNPRIRGVRSHIYTYGHRNAQGLAFGPDDRLYATEHGPKTDDELNLLEAGMNYGWPYVAGQRDDRAYEYADWSAAGAEVCARLDYDSYALPSEVPRQRESAWSHPDFRPPILSLYAVDDGFPFDGGDCAAREPSCWPTIAPASLTYDPARRALLIPSLKRGTVLEVPLDGDGNPRPPRELYPSKNRYRDLVLAGGTVYVITDSEGYTSGPTKKSTQVLQHRGAILAFVR